MAERIFSKVLNLKLNQFMDSKFSCQAKFVFLEDNSSQAKAILETAKRNPSAPLIISHSQLMVPYRFEGHLLGVAVVPNITSFFPGDIENIRVGLLSYLNHISWSEDPHYQDLLSGTGSDSDQVIWLFA